MVGQVLLHRLAKQRFLCDTCAHDWRAIRIEPPLCVSDEICDRFALALAREIRFVAEKLM